MHISDCVDVGKKFLISTIDPWIIYERNHNLQEFVATLIDTNIQSMVKTSRNNTLKKGDAMRIVPALNTKTSRQHPETLLYSSGSHLDTFQTVTGIVSQTKEVLFVTKSK